MNYETKQKLETDLLPNNELFGDLFQLDLNGFVNLKYPTPVLGSRLWDL